MDVSGGRIHFCLARIRAGLTAPPVRWIVLERDVRLDFVEVGSLVLAQAADEGG